MADPEYRKDPRRKDSEGWNWALGLMGLVALVLIVWWIWPSGDTQIGEFDTDQVGELGQAPDAPDADAPGIGAPGADEPAGQARTAEITIPRILETPESYEGQTFSGEVQVAEAPTETVRGFWAESEGERIFVLFSDQPAAPPNLPADQSVRIEQAEVRTPADLSALTGAPLSEETRQIVEGEDVFLVADAANVMPAGGAGEAGGADQPAEPAEETPADTGQAPPI